MLVFSRVPITADEVGLARADSRATHYAYYKRHAPTRVADAWSAWGNYACAGALAIAYALIIGSAELSLHGHRVAHLEDTGIVFWLAAITAFVLGNGAAFVDSARSSIVLYCRRATTREDLRSTVAATIARLRAAPEATQAHIDRLVLIRAAVLGVLGSSGIGGLVLYAIEHNLVSIWHAIASWSAIHPTLAHISVLPVELAIGLTIYSIHYLNVEISFCKSAIRPQAN